ncbi:MAG: hypothetical protein WCI51_01805 [Lentisphaerota bacterium]
MSRNKKITHIHAAPWEHVRVHRGGSRKSGAGIFWLWLIGIVFAIIFLKEILILILWTITASAIAAGLYFLVKSVHKYYNGRKSGAASYAYIPKTAADNDFFQERVCTVEVVPDNDISHLKARIIQKR